MVADIFYPIFTLKITVLACFVQKQTNVGGFAPTMASPWTPWWAYSSPIPPAAKKRCAHIFSGLSPEHVGNLNTTHLSLYFLF